METAPDLLPELVTDIPGPRSRALAARLGRCECPDTTYLADDFPVFWERGAGCNVWDADGNRLVDLTSAFGVCSLGHGHPAQRAALRTQSERLVHAMGDVHPSSLKVEVAEALGRIAPDELDVVLFGSSGSDAIEAALKTAMVATDRPGAVAFEGAYHGLGYGALALTARAHFRAPFLAQLNPHVVHLPYPGREAGIGPGAVAVERGAGAGAADSRVSKAKGTRVQVAEVLELLDGLLGGAAGESIGAVVVEPIQARGGVVVPEPSFLQGLREICSRRDRFLVVDEIMTGLGRTGSWFACEQAGIVPDLLCVGKSLAGGLPLSACIGSDGVMSSWEPSDGEARHTQTFLGNPLACAVASATLDVLEREGWPARVAARGETLGQDLAAALDDREGVVAIRGRGMLWGIELATRAGLPDGERTGAVVRRALQRGFILLAAGDAGHVLEIVPPFVLGAAQWRGALDVLAVLLDEIPPSI